MISALVGFAAASEVCQNSMNEMGIGYDECLAIQAEFVSFVDSGMSVDQLSTELANCDTMATCGDCNHGCSESCLEVQNNGSCNIPVAGCARQVAYGGYVKSHVLIQCYGMIDEGCKKLPTIYGPTEVKTAAPAGGAAGGADRMPSCDELCHASCAQQDNCCHPTGQPGLGGVNTCCGSDCKEWGMTCMKSNFANYLRCVGRRVSKCYRQKWVVSKECINAAPQEIPGCQKEWNQEYKCTDNCKNTAGGSGYVLA
jgi:hypothetical protein